MRVALDYTPAISQGAGVGRYTRSLVSALVNNHEQSAEWCLWYPRDVDDDGRYFPKSDQVTRLQVPLSTRMMNALWHRVGLPLRFERYSGPVSVVHGTDFVVPPSKAPSVVTVHDLSFIVMPEVAYPRLRRYLTRALPKSIDRSTRIIAVSAATKDDICSYFEIAPHRVEVIHNGVDPIFCPPTSSKLLQVQAQFGLRRPYFVSVGTVEPRKDHATLLKAFEHVHQRHPEVSLVIIGRKGWLADDIMEKIKQASEKMPVMHIQGVHDDALPALYGGSVAMVYPSRYEGFGLPVLEAMASGTTVICSDTPALREIAGEAADTFETGNVEQLIELMSRSLEFTGNREQSVRAGIKHARRYTWDAAAAEHLRVYTEVASE